MDRREFLHQSSLLGAAAVSAGRAVAAERPMPRIKLGEFSVSRLILGSNPFWGYAHQPGDVGARMVAYYTDERIMATLDAAADLGVTAVASPPEARWLGLWARYRAGGGKMPHWIAQPHAAPEAIDDEIARAVDGGASAVFIQGHRVEVQFEGSTFAAVARWLEGIQRRGVPAGMAAHRPDVHLEAQRQEFPVDFYYQCFYNLAHGEEYREEDRLKAVATIAQLRKPVIGYKILAAGRNDPDAAFAFALRHLRASDGVCVGIYTEPRPDELKLDVALLKRGRPGRAG